jgi:hypothetical protein
VEKYVTAGQATDDNIIRRMRVACWKTKATDTHSEYVILLFHGNNGYANAPRSYIIRTLPLLLFLNKVYNHFQLELSTNNIDSELRHEPEPVLSTSHCYNVLICIYMQ